MARKTTKFRTEMEPVERPSRTQKKRDLEQLYNLGEVLLELPQGKFDRVYMPDELRTAMLAARNMTVFSARKRQLQFVRGLMRDSDVLQIRESLEQIDHANQKKRPMPPRPTPSAQGVEEER